MAWSEMDWNLHGLEIRGFSVGAGGTYFDIHCNGSHDGEKGYETSR